MYLQLFRTIGYLALLAGVGFVVFRPRWMQRVILPRFLWLMLKVLFPFYFVARIPTGWASAMVLGWPMLITLFGLCVVMLVLQAWIAERLTRGRIARVSQPASYVLLAALHNAGFIPLPILERLVPEAVMIGMFFYLLAFNISFWAVAVPLIESGHLSLKHARFKLNAPIFGIALGFVIAIFGWHTALPESVVRVAGSIGDLALDGALVALGASLAGIREKIRFTREHWVFLGWRMVLYPAVTLVVVALPWPGLNGPLGWALRTMLVLEAAAPPATQTLVVTRALGTPEQLHYTGVMILVSYVAALVTIPLFVSAAIGWFV